MILSTYPTGTYTEQRNINKSLGIGEEHIIWIDETHIDAKHGHKVFDEEKKAVKKLMHVIDDKKASEEVKGVCEEAIGKLTSADEILAVAAYEDAVAAYNESNDVKVREKIEKGDRVWTGDSQLMQLLRFGYLDRRGKVAAEWATCALEAGTIMGAAL